MVISLTTKDIWQRHSHEWFHDQDLALECEDLGGQWEWECPNEYMVVNRKQGVCMRRLSKMDARKQKQRLGALWVRVQARSRWHTHVGKFEVNLAHGLFTKVWVGFGNRNKEWWRIPELTTIKYCHHHWAGRNKGENDYQNPDKIVIWEGPRDRSCGLQ